MPMHIDKNDPRYRHAAAASRRRPDNFQPEANITSALRDFLILTGLGRREEIIEENSPSEASRRAVDLAALDTFIELKWRIGTKPGGEPDPWNVRQLDDYLAQSKLPIPEFDPKEPLHAAISEAGRVAAQGVARQLAPLCQDRTDVAVTIARRELRKWLRESTEGKAVEELLGTRQVATNPLSGGL